MDFQGLADQIHNTIAETFLRKKKIVARSVNATFSFLQMITFGAKIFHLLQVNLQKTASRVNGVIIVGVVKLQKKLARLFRP